MPIPTLPLQYLHQSAKTVLLLLSACIVTEVIKEIEEDQDNAGEGSEQEAEPEPAPAGPMGDKLLELRMRLNEARKKNSHAVAEENERLQDPQFERRRRRKEWEQEDEVRKGNLEQKGVGADKGYLNDPLTKCKSRYSKQEKKASKKKTVYGWDVFNQDTLYRAYKKRLKKMPFDKEEYEEQVKSGTVWKDEVGADKLQKLVDDIDKQYGGRSET